MARPLISVHSEIGKLRTVLLHRPGSELEWITPEYLEELLFDDIPWLAKMQIEHDQFAGTLRDRGCKVLYYETLLADILGDMEVRKRIIIEVLDICHIRRPKLREMIIDILLKKQSSEVAEIIIAGLHKTEVPHDKGLIDLSFFIRVDHPFYFNPLPNLYFTRDPGTVIGAGLSINSMHTPARKRETMILHYIYQHHPRFKPLNAPLWYDYSYEDSIEGGDILVLSDSVVAIGCSARTTPQAIERIAANLFHENSSFNKVLAIEIPFTRAYMHLDTVFTMVDHDKFTIYPGVEQHIRVFLLTPGKEQQVKITPEENLQKVLKEALNLPAVDLIQSGGGNIITAAREQWNDSTNTLCIAPGVVVTYNRNVVSNDTLRKRGIEVVEIEGSELVRGRGGPRCMSMPLARDAIS